MKKWWIFLGIFCLLSLVFIGWWSVKGRDLMKKDQPVTENDLSQPAAVSDENNLVQDDLNSNDVTENSDVPSWATPLPRVSERVTKKPFGIYIDPATSPVQPERFQGYHTGTDFEVFPEEENQSVAVAAVCSGRILLKQYVSGYGGVLVTSCIADNEQITVLYGHLDLNTINWAEWGEINTGDVIGELGEGYSSETDGERKHLHLSFHRGEAVTLAGYVANEVDLGNWLDPCKYVCE